LGIEMTLSGGRVRLRASRRPPIALVRELRQHKEELRVLLGRRYAYRFKLVGSQGAGTYITDEPDLKKARATLENRYGIRLAMVARA
jgi:hypothetical protein